MSRYADIIKKKQKDWNCEELMSSANREAGSKIPFSSPLMNYCTYGGIPRAAITEFFGDPGGGKTTTSVDICKNAVVMFESEYDAEVAKLQDVLSNGKNPAVSAQLADLQDRGPKRVLYIDLEHSFDKKWSKTLGIDDSKIDVMQPPDVVAEDILQTMQEIIETGEIGLIVLDSVPSLVPRNELEKKIGERTVAALAGVLTVHLRKVVPLLKRYDTTIIYINQTRDNLDNPYVVNTPGGKGLKFYASLRMLFKIGTPVDFLGNELPSNTENPAGYIVTAKLVKQKSAPWDRKLGSYYLMCNSGIRIDMDYANLAVKKYGIIHKAGAWFTLTVPGTGEVLVNESGLPVKLNGMSKVFDYLQENPEYFKLIQDYIMNDINNTPSEVIENE